MLGDVIVEDTKQYGDELFIYAMALMEEAADIDEADENGEETAQQV